ncbi:MAG: adenosine kinase [Prevotellaceae bacterium]|nr:adenosine kinase [Prevotellaceae bacterium]
MIKSVLGAGNALVDILAIIPDHSLLEKYKLPVGSMQHVDEPTANRVYDELKQFAPSVVSGGSAANAVRAMAELGMTAGFFGKVGHDELGDLYDKDLRAAGIHSLLKRDDASTGRAMVLVLPDAERTFAVHLGAAALMNPDDIPAEAFDDYDCLHIEGYLIQNHSLIETAMKCAKQKGKTVSLDLASYNVVEEHLDFLRGIVERYTDIVFANEEEARAFAGVEPEKAVEILGSLCDIAVVKLGARGSIVKHGDELHRLPAIPVTPVDLTGAGDLYAAGFFRALSSGLDLAACAKAGTVCAAEIIKLIGTKLPAEALSNVRAAIAKL